MIGLGAGYAVALVALVAFAVVIGLVARLGVARATATASVRAVVQLGAVSLIIVAVLRSWPAALAFVGVMVVVACVTSARRIGRHRGSWWAAAAIVGGVVPVFGLMMASGAVPLSTVAVVPVAGILIGGTMTATSLAGRRAVDVLRTRYGEYEAALALGFAHRDAALLICRPHARDALVPALDQTRTVGLVTLPGAFVGVLLGGGSPVQAGAVQVLVLVGLLAAETVATVVTTELVVRQRIQWTIRDPDGPRRAAPRRRRPCSRSGPTVHP